MRLRCLWILLGVIMTPAMAGAAVSVQASVDRTVLAPGESLILQVSVSGGKGEVDTDGIDDFKVVSRGSRTSVQVVNGQISEEKAYTFTLIPVREGRLTIPPLPVHSGGDTYHTREIALSVSRTPANPGAGAREVVERGTVFDQTPRTRASRSVTPFGSDSGSGSPTPRSSGPISRGLTSGNSRSGRNTAPFTTAWSIT